MKSKLLMCGAVALMGILVLGFQPAKAGLIGDSVTGSLGLPYFSFHLDTQFTSPQTVGPGVEFTGTFDDTGTGKLFTIAADVQDTGFTIRIENNGEETVSWPTHELMSVSLGSLDLGSAITGVSYSGYSCYGSTCQFGVGPNVDQLTFTANSVYVSFDHVRNGELYSFTLASAPTGVPEPSTLLLLGSGLAGLAGLAWRKN